MQAEALGYDDIIDSLEETPEEEKNTDRLLSGIAMDRVTERPPRH